MSPFVDAIPKRAEEWSPSFALAIQLDRMLVDDISANAVGMAIASHKHAERGDSKSRAHELHQSPRSLDLRDR